MYFQVCEKLLLGDAVSLWNSDQEVPFVKYGDYLVAYENEESLRIKVSIGINAWPLYYVVHQVNVLSPIYMMLIICFMLLSKLLLRCQLVRRDMTTVTLFLLLYCCCEGYNGYIVPYKFIYKTNLKAKTDRTWQKCWSGTTSNWRMFAVLIIDFQ